MSEPKVADHVTISALINSLKGIKNECGDLPVSMFNQREGLFGSFTSMVLPQSTEGEDFLGIISKGDVKAFMELATSPETNEQ